MTKYLGAAIGNCVHIGGIVNFLRIAEDEGNHVEFLGAAVGIEKFVKAVMDKKPDIACIGFRLTPESVVPLLDSLQENIRKHKLSHIKWIFGGTKPVAEIAKEYSFFSKIFDGTEDIDEVISYIRGKETEEVNVSYPQNIIDRIKGKYPYPVLRHHFGLPSYKETLEGVKKIAESKVLDVISIGPDQNTQESGLKKLDQNILYKCRCLRI